MATQNISIWVAPADFEEFRQFYETDKLTLFTGLTDLVKCLRQERDTCRPQLSDAHTANDTLEEQVTQLNLDLRIARASSISTSTTHDTHPLLGPQSTFRSEKFTGPEKFHGTRAKLPGFIIQLRMKLEMNGDRFRNEAATVIYSINRMEGKALDQMVPLVNANPLTLFPSILAFFAYLEASFGDPDPRSTALQGLETLKQGHGDYATYCTSFLRNIAYLDYKKSAKIDALAKGLSDVLKDAMAYRFERPRTLKESASTLMMLDNRIRGRKAEQRNDRNTAIQFPTVNTAHPSHVAGGLVPMDLPAIKSQPASRPPPEQRYFFVNGMRKTTAAEKQWRRDNNLCMYYAGAGHDFSNCPTANRSKNNQVTMSGAMLANLPVAQDLIVSQPSTSEASFQVSRI